ncbi:MAG: clpP1 [Firmicutes bacterium]|nr:clpP1 [Bacillota bacterium]
MKKCWSIKNEVDSENADLLLYGEISDATWWGDEVTPAQFASDLAALDGKNVNVRINSPGGDVFAAHAILSQLNSYSGDVTVYVDGLAASAATIIMMAGKVIMPCNSMVMIHNPAVGLVGYYSADDMMKMAGDLEIVKQSIMAAYKTKCKLDDKKLSKLMNEETWMTAETAKQYGFADEVTGSSDAVNMVMDGSFLVVNSVKHDVSRLKNTGQLKQLINMVPPRMENREPKEEKEMPINTIDDLKKEKPELVNQVVDDAVQTERARIAALDALNDPQNAAIHDLVDDAKKTGKTVDEIKTAVDIVKKHSSDMINAAEIATAQAALKAAIVDNKGSGIDGAVATGTNNKDADNKQKDAADINFMASVINKKNGRVK